MPRQGWGWQELGVCPCRALQGLWEVREPAPEATGRLKEVNGPGENQAAKWLIGFASISPMNIHEVRCPHQPAVCIQPPCVPGLPYSLFLH